MKKIGYTITKNGKSKHLPKTLDNLENFLDYLLISVDKSSSDGTYKYCKKHPAVDDVIAHQGEWPLEEPNIRNRAYMYAKAENPDADILLSIDDDEIIVEKDKANRIFEFMLEKEIHLGCAQIYHLWDEKHYRKDETWAPENIMNQICQNLHKEIGTWSAKGPHCGRLPVEGGEGKQTGTFTVLHLGWILPEKKQKEKLREKRNRHKNPEGIQKRHYETFDNEPELQEIPDEWKNYL